MKPAAKITPPARHPKTGQFTPAGTSQGVAPPIVIKANIGTTLRGFVPDRSKPSS